MPYLASSENERQVYLNGGKMTMLTNRRLVEIKQMRPIDKLYNLLTFIQESNSQQHERIYDDFLDFAAFHSMEETCAMLL